MRHCRPAARPVGPGLRPARRQHRRAATPPSRTSACRAWRSSESPAPARRRRGGRLPASRPVRCVAVQCHTASRLTQLHGIGDTPSEAIISPRAHPGEIAGHGSTRSTPLARVASSREIVAFNGTRPTMVSAPASSRTSTRWLPPSAISNANCASIWPGSKTKVGARHGANASDSPCNRPDVSATRRENYSGAGDDSGPGGINLQAGGRDGGVLHQKGAPWLDTCELRHLVAVQLRAPFPMRDTHYGSRP